MAQSGLPFDERGGRLRGGLDLLSGRYPPFLFGAGLGAYLPVFHFHEVTVEHLEPRLRFLAENGYSTVVSDDVSNLVRHGRRPGPRSVALAFDDAHESFWTIAAPLLRRYGMRAILYAIPGRIEEAAAVRPTIDDDPGLAHRPAPGPRFVTWPELQAVQASGVADVQSHTWSHSMVFSSDRLLGFVAPGYEDTLPLNRPLISDDGPLEWIRPTDLGTPIYAHRSRMSDGLRYFPDPDAAARCRSVVNAAGGAAFFARPRWSSDLAAVANGSAGRIESPAERERAVLEELGRSRDELGERLRTNSVRHICLPWGVAGDVTLEALRRTGYETAFSNQWSGSMAVRAGDPPYRLKRLHSRFLTHLPGRGRTLVGGWLRR
jgi:Polysaccharide deacetylase